MKTLFILHGWQSSKERWQKVKEKIEEAGINVIVPDIPGFKPETETQRPWDLDDYVNWLDKFCQQKKIDGELVEPFFLLGHSFGGALAVKFALKYPGKVERLFLVGAACIRKKTAKKKVLSKLSKIFKIFSFLPFYSTIRKAFYKFIVGHSDYLSAKGLLKETYLKIIGEDLSRSLSSITTPTVIIWGDKDEATPVEDAYFINEKINNSKLIVIPGGTHDLKRKMPEVLVQKIIDNLPC